MRNTENAQARSFRDCSDLCAWVYRALNSGAAQKKKAAGPTSCRFDEHLKVLAYFLLTAFFSSAPGVNLATLRAAILIVAPVCGFRPLRAFLCETENVPKPIKATRSPFLRAAVMLSTAVSIAVVACVLLISQAPAIRSTRSALFIVSPRQNPVLPQQVWGSWNMV